MDLLVKLMRLSPPPYFLVERQKKTLPQWVNIIVVRLALAHVDLVLQAKLPRLIWVGYRTDWFA